MTAMNRSCIIELNNKIVLVTGALGVLGQAMCRAALAAGATVYGVDCVNGEPVAGVQALEPLDLGDVAATEACYHKLAIQQGRIDALVNIAGGFAWETLAEGGIETWDQQYNINVRTAVNSCKAVLPHFPSSGGRIVNVSALGALKAAAGMGAYATAKSGVARLTEALAEEQKVNNITVNAVMPSVIDTPANRRDMPDADFSSWVGPDALADIILFLLSARAEAITGALIPVNGRV